MKNIFDEEVDPRDMEFHFEWNFPRLTVLRGKPYTNQHGVENCQKYCGAIMPNGWNGHSFNLYYPLGKPIWNGFSQVDDISLEEMKMIVEEYCKRANDREIMAYVVSKIASEKHISFEETLKHIKAKNIPCIIDLEENPLCH